MGNDARSIAVAVVIHGGRVLVGRRAVDAAGAAGLDEFPGGKIEPDETSAAAAARECLEEAGVAVRILDRSVEVTTPLRIRFHWASPLDPAATPREPFEWIPLAQLATRHFPGANAVVLETLRLEHW